MAITGFPTSSQTDSSGLVTTTNADGTIQTSQASSGSIASEAITNPSVSDAESLKKISNPTNIVNLSQQLSANVAGLAESLTASLKPSATPTTPPRAVAKFGHIDQRVRLIVPDSYLINQAAGPNGELKRNGGIIFPYTPSITLDHSANYEPFNAVHSNYTQNFYKSSAVSDIKITGKFSAQNDIESQILLGVIHLLRALTKMKFGDDPNAGAPPPVCRLMAYGPYMLDMVPVVIKGFNFDLPEGIDYFTAGADQNNFLYGSSSVPVFTTINLTLSPVYSRREMLNGTVSGWLTGNQRAQGYL